MGKGYADRLGAVGSGDAGGPAVEVVVRVVVLVVVMLGGAGCARPCDPDDYSCDMENMHPECVDGEARCFCDDGFAWNGDACAVADHEACCGCLASTCRLGDQVPCDNQFDDPCISSASQCVTAFSNGQPVSSSGTCFDQHCAGDCWYIEN